MKYKFKCHRYSKRSKDTCNLTECHYNSTWKNCSSTYLLQQLPASIISMKLCLTCTYRRSLLFQSKFSYLLFEPPSICWWFSSNSLVEQQGRCLLFQTDLRQVPFHSWRNDFLGIDTSTNSSTNSTQCYKYEFHRGLELFFLKLAKILTFSNIPSKVFQK